MKRTVLTFSLLICIFSSTMNLFSQNPEPGNKPLVTYIESSSGLSSPEWEGGRTELEFADMNGDGNVDIITIGDHGNPGIQSGEQGLMVYFGDGQGNWSCQMGGNLGYGGIAAGDVNNDGLMDVGYGMHHNYSSTDFGDQLIEVALGDGTGTNWTPWDDGLATNGEDWAMFGTDFADIDNDGDLDIGSMSMGCCSGVHIYKNNLDGSWTQSFESPDGNSTNIIQFGDINNDGNADFVIARDLGTVYFGDGTGNFELYDLNLPSSGSVGRYGPSLGDINNDGGMDLAFVSYSGGLYVYVFHQDIGEWANFSGNLPVSGDFEMTQLADMNTDGFIDLAAYGEGTFRLFLGDGTGNWTADATFTTGDPGDSRAFRVGGDIDHNGRPDIVLVEEEGDWISYQNFLKCYKENSVPYSLSVSAVFPHGNELLRPGSAMFIDWISAVPLDEPTSQVALEYSATGPEGPWTFIASELPNNGRYQWIVPQVNSTNSYIRYTVSAGIMVQSGITPVAFTITDGSIGVIENNKRDFDLKLYPNPANSQLTLTPSPSLPQLGEGVRVGANGWELPNITISDLFGRKLISLDNLSSFPYQIDISSLSPGMYIARMTTDDGFSGSAKFLKVAK
jgi:hypothetical protein